MASAPELMRLSDIPPIDPAADAKLLPEITETIVPLINRHINPSRFRDPELRDEFPTVTTYMGENGGQWTPALAIPWTVGENFPRDYQWTPADSPLPAPARSSLVVGVLTEDNLPYYSETIDRKFGTNKAMGFWNKIWTAEEGRHAEVMRWVMTVGRLVDPVQLERDRMEQVITAEVPNPPSVAESMVYVAIQELATRVSHQNTGKLIADTAVADDELFPLNADGTALANMDPDLVRGLEPEQRDSYMRNVGRAVMTRIAGDENKHFAFYRDAVKNGALVLDPSTVVKAIERQVRGFQMPGTGIRDFWAQAALISDAGVYDLRIHHDTILKPLVMGDKGWGLESIEGLDDDAERARERTVVFMEGLDAAAARMEEERDERRAADPDAIWVGKEAA